MNTDRKVCVALMVLLAVSACSPRVHSQGRLYDQGPTRTTGMLHLHATYTAPYCGGADPGDDVPRPQPWQGTMYLRRAMPDSTGLFALNDLRSPIVDTLRTDGSGNGTVVLLAGTYLLLDRDLVDDQRYQQLLKDHAKPTLHTEPIDQECMDRWLHGPFGVVTITGGDTNHVELPLFDQCPWYSTPCVRYDGPLPP
jgi:hypothetical protein